MTATGLVPLIRYRDPEAAVRWLTEAFGLTARSVVRDADGSIAYAELSFGHGIVMIGPVGDSGLDELLRQPDEIGGVGTQACYVAVGDVAAHLKRAREAGAEIVLDFGSDGAGDRAYAARDPEGHIWNFGVYSPWRTDATASPGDGAQAMRSTTLHSALAASVAVLAVVTATAVFLTDPTPANPAVAHVSSRSAAPVELQRPGPATAIVSPPAAPSPAAAPEPGAIEDALERALHVRRELARSAAQLRTELDRERRLREAAEIELKVLRAKQSSATPKAPAADAAAAETAPAPLPSDKREPPHETAAIPDAGRAAPAQQPGSAVPAASAVTSPGTTSEPAADGTAVRDPAIPKPETSLAAPEQAPAAFEANLGIVPAEAPTAPAITGTPPADAAAPEPATAEGVPLATGGAKPVQRNPKRNADKPAKPAKAQKRAAAVKKPAKSEAPKPAGTSSGTASGDPFFLYDP